jgi:uncharacterized protein
MCVMTTAYPSSHVHDTQRHPWRFWSTFGWFVVACMAVMGAEYVVVRASAISVSIPIHVDLLAWKYLTSIISLLAAAVSLALVARWRGPSASAYLGLVWPRSTPLLAGFGVIAALWLAITGLDILFPQAASAEQLNQYRALLGKPMVLVLYWFFAVIVAPVTEEIIFRGFLQTGWSESRIGVIGALLLATSVFTWAHPQYDARGMAEVFAVGLVLGMTRWWSGSLLLTIMMHASWNFTNNVIRALVAG